MWITDWRLILLRVEIWKRAIVNPRRTRRKEKKAAGGEKMCILRNDRLCSQDRGISCGGDFADVANQ